MDGAVMRRTGSRGAGLVLGALFLSGLGCAEPTQESVLAPPPPGIEAKPRWLTFTCVEPGCETTRVSSVKVVGARAVAIKRIVLSERDRDDFELVTSKEAPFVLGVGETLELSASFRPTGDPRLGDVSVVVTYTDASAEEAEDRILPGELEIPLVRRLVGEPQLSVAPTVLNFGAVLPNSRKVMPLTLRNAGFGNVGVVVDSVQSDDPDVRVDGLPEFAVLPDAAHDVDVTYSPRIEKYTEATIMVRSADTSAAPALVGVIGTSIPRPSISALPAGGIDFGEIPVGMSATAMLEIVNQGSETLELYRWEALGAGASNLDVQMPQQTMTPTVASLSSIVATLRLDGTTPGPVNATLRLRSNDRANRDYDVEVRGLVTEPNLQVSPGQPIDFGVVPRGWVLPQRVELENIGYGDLRVERIDMAVGSSELFTLTDLPRLPAVLGHQERLSFRVEYRAEAEARFNGTITISSNDPDSGFVELPVTAQGASCDVGCPIANGSPSCAGGVCSVGRCDPGFYDTDSLAASGCECAEIGRDPGSFCADGHWAGTLTDTDGDRANFTGVLAEDGDVDIITFFAEDAFSWFSDDYDVRIRLESSDPTIEMCVYRHDTAQHENACFMENERCGRDFRRDGSAGSEDGADYVVKISRRNGAGATCTPYTVFMRNG